MAEIDALCSLATVSADHKMTKPIFISNNFKPSLKIIQMRHPLVEKQNVKEFVANDVVLSY